MILTKQYVWPQGVTTGLYSVRQHKTQSKSDDSIIDGFTDRKDVFGSAPRFIKNDIC